MAPADVPFPRPAQVGAEEAIRTCGYAGRGTVVRGQSRVMMLPAREAVYLRLFQSK